MWYAARLFRLGAFLLASSMCQCGCQAQTERGVTSACQAIGLITVTILARVCINIIHWP